MKRNALTLILILALTAPALAQQPVWALPTDQLVVVNVGTSNGMAYATIRDNGMRGHNVYCISTGAHFGNVTVTRISVTGVQLSNGHTLPVPAADTAVAAIATSNQ